MVELVSPGWGGVFSVGTDSLSWEFPYETCDPEGYEVQISTNPEFTSTILDSRTGSPNTSLDPGSIFQPATKYYWQVSAYVGETVGPGSGAQYFYTEPVCDAGSMQAPVLTSPADSTEITTLNPQFEWSYPDPNCYPNGFYFKVSEDPDLNTFAIESDSPDHWADDIAFGVPLEDCKTYFYQVIPYVDGVAGPASDVFKFVTNLTGLCECDPAALPVPSPLLPSPYSAGNPVIVPVDMQVVWDNPGPCIPDGYEIELDSDFEYSDSPYNGGVTGGETTEYSPPTLEPARQYWWHVFSTYQGSLSASSTFATFFTGPECTSSSQLAAPVILFPNNGAFLNTDTPIFRYIPGNPGCIPDTFRIELNTDPNFQGQSMELEPFLTTTVGFSDPLNDCTMYYLRVAAIQDGTLGPYSPVHRFYVNALGTCFPSPIGKANQNVFCKIGPDWDFGVHLFNKDDWIQAIARNPGSSYLEVYVPDESGENAADPPVTCWIPINAFSPDEEYNLPEMFVNYPPAAPVVGADGKLVCSPSLPDGKCQAAGGKYLGYPYPCICD